jgi:integrase/recombinase XerD
MQVFRRHKVNDNDITVLSRYEIDKIISVADNIKHRAIIELLYSSGLRVSECAALKFTDLDRNQMLIHVRGKGDKPRSTILSKRCLETLTIYYRQCRPINSLFEGHHQKPISTHMIEIAVKSAAAKAGVTKKVTPHILRHSFATHLLEDGVALPVIQQLLGHEHIKTTVRYTHVTTDLIRKVTSPLDRITTTFNKDGRHA